MATYRRLRRASLLTSILALGLFLLTLRLLYGKTSSSSVSTSRSASPATHRLGQVTSSSPACARLPGAKDTLVILKTGATELQDKLPVHFHTTFSCYPNYIIFSDVEEEYEGHHIIDALEFVHQDYRGANKDFELWRRLQTGGRADLKPEELSGPDSKVSPMTGKGSNPGWKLDKWKFLPMVNRTLNMYPDMKWYIFVETDTYMFWSTTLAYLNSLDHREPWYMGSQMQIGSVVFAHGGSGIFASQAALRMVVDLFVANQNEWEKFTAMHWAGDCVLGKAFTDAGVDLTWAWPTIQGVKPGSIEYDRYDYRKRLWCYPTISYHHLSPNEVEDIWNFEQDWLKKGKGEVVRHSDVFISYIMPRIMATKGSTMGWDNMSGNFENAVESESYIACRRLCDEDDYCAQFAYKDGQCKKSGSPQWGEANPAVQSGWLLDRVEQFVKNQEPCSGELWVERGRNA